MVRAKVSVSSRYVEEAAKILPLSVHGKFFFQGSEKFFVKGVAYGPFARASHGAPFPERSMVDRDFALMRQMGVNCVRTFTVPPPWLLDAAAASGLHVLIGIPWAQHVCFLDSPSLLTEIRQTVRAAVRGCRGHPAVFAYLVGNEIPPDIIRWHGPQKIQKFLRNLIMDAKDEDPAGLVSYANFPSTEYLELDSVDFLSFNVYLHRAEDFRRYLARLHNLAEDKPLVLTEFGIDSIREGAEAQGEILSWQIRICFETGAAGAVVFSWTDDWFTGGLTVEDWAFGLVDRERRKKPAFFAVQKCYTSPLPPPLPHYPRASVIVCAYNAERTIDQCLSSLVHLRYPNYEIIVVNDGSTDRTLEIAQKYLPVRPGDPAVSIISQENKGLSTARNVGILAAEGEIIAFTDADCVADPDWLYYLAAKLLSSRLVAVGGPNFPPPEDSLVPACVAAAPGGPTHVLLSDEVAEHIPGCNMAFRKDALVEIHAFDPLFTAAGDDVDVCWRLQNQGHVIGFSPAAMVWHFRRHTVSAYLRQQKGYGKAEALLYFKHPYRFNFLGQSRWFGRIYGDLALPLLTRRPVIYSGVFGRGLFQTLYEPPSSLLSYLPFTLEWNVVAGILFLSAVLSGGPLWLLSLPLSISLGCSVVSAVRARIPSPFGNWRGRILVALLIYLGPLVRSYERYRWRIKELTEVAPIEFDGPLQKPRIRWGARAFVLTYWTEEGREKESLLQGIIEFLFPRKYLVSVDQGWNPWDLEVYRGIWSKTRIKVVEENHGGPRRLLRVRCERRMTRPARIAMLLYAAMAGVGGFLELPELLGPSLVIGGLHLSVMLYNNYRLGRVLYHVVEIVAQRINLHPVEETTS